MRDMICIFAQANFNGHEAAPKYLQLYPRRRQPNHKLFRNLYNRLGETGSFRSKSRTVIWYSENNTSGRRRNLNSCFRKYRCEYSSVKCGNGAKPIVHFYCLKIYQLVYNLFSFYKICKPNTRIFLIRFYLPMR
ncbi:hypothetical protein NQ318_009668 [Aromia moschata]|uniref:Uncharacterized protein n=1 Tax=Aromia moschata TaxID=1265417 RepID=A0AAV8XYT5_9CUCU|nr:hypothetical protein NQ318_009668 [Aromia moschata]